MMFRIGLLVAFLAVMAASSWITLQALDYWDASRSGSASVSVAATSTNPRHLISIVEATYGLSCKDFKVAPPAANMVSVGNATAGVAGLCDKKYGTCKYPVDVARLGDPAGGCGKDFLVKWRCGFDSIRTHEARLSAEAHGRSISIVCPR
jgi:hypothetical protein